MVFLLSPRVPGPSESPRWAEQEEGGRTESAEPSVLRQIRHVVGSAFPCKRLHNAVDDS